MMQCVIDLAQAICVVAEPTELARPPRVELFRDHYVASATKAQARRYGWSTAVSLTQH